VLETRVGPQASLSWSCRRTLDWHVAFLNFWEFARPDCLCEELALFYDRDTQGWGRAGRAG